MSYQANCSFPDGVYSSTNKPSVTTLQADITELEGKHNSHDADTTIHMTIATIMGVVYPVGSVFTSVVDTDPATLLGFGTWSRIAEGQMLVGYKTGDADFGTVEGTGGAKTASIAHTHSINTGGASDRGTDSQLSSHSHTINDHTHTYSGNANTSAEGSQTSDMNQGDENATRPSTGHVHSLSWSGTTSSPSNRGTDSANLAHSHTINDHTHTATSGAMSANATPSILNPYFVIYAWKRTE